MLEVGSITKIKIGQDGSGGGWFLERVTINNMRTNALWNFFCGKWLSKEYLFFLNRFLQRHFVWELHPSSARGFRPEAVLP